MAQEAEQAITVGPWGRTRRTLGFTLRLTLLLTLLVLAYAWFVRERIADDLIGQALRERGIEASYEIERIGTGRQVLSNLVIGDPARPDLTVEQVEVFLSPRFGFPAITDVRVVRPRLFGSYRQGQLSFGALDPLIFTDSEEPFRLPDLRLVIEDGRALIASDYGQVGAKLVGSGHLRDGFAGELAVSAPQLVAGGCTGTEATLYGGIAIEDQEPRFRGPLRIGELACANGLRISDAGAQLSLRGNRDLTRLAGEAGLSAAALAFAEARASLRGDSEFVWSEGRLEAQYDLRAGNVTTPAVNLAQLALEGRLSAQGGFADVALEGELAGANLRPALQFDRALAEAASASEGTMLAPLLGRLRGGLSRELPGSALSASYAVRLAEGRTSVAVPQANLRGRGGASLLTISRGQMSLDAGGSPRFAGSFATGGADLPQLSGRAERGADGALEMRLAMRDYSAGGSRLALPELRLTQRPDGTITLAGNAVASGAILGGSVSGLRVPIDGTLAANGDLAMWAGCRTLRFDSLALTNLALDRQSLELCPQRGVPILRYDSRGVQLAASTDALRLAGTLGGAGIRIETGTVGLAWPGTMAVRDLAITIDPAGEPQHFAIGELTADLSAPQVSGTFTGAEVLMAMVPLDLGAASGVWSYADSRVSLSEATFTLADREAIDRFEPMLARDATLTISGGLVDAHAVLRHPASDTALARLRIVHNLASSVGHADLIVDGVTFGPQLQPSPSAAHCFPDGTVRRTAHNGLTCLTLGVVSDVAGTVSGSGRIDWSAEAISSSGSFSTDALDLAAAFGPVHGISGTVNFTDLLALTTAPGQVAQIGAVNPGIEVYDGEVSYQLVGGEMLVLEGARWPFMGGTLTMQPVTLRFGMAEVRRYVLVIDGLQANRFVQQMEMSNVAASGTFDGTIPVVFDESGNGQLMGGVLNSRAPGGNVAYVGELTYQDMGFFANYTFQALRDLRYDSMEVVMNGPLTGELVTQVRFTGVGQGDTAQRNIITRALGRLPIELRLNIRAPFYKLMTSIRALYDPASIRDPRELGLLGNDGEPPPSPPPDNVNGSEPSIQPQESDESP